MGRAGHLPASCFIVKVWPDIFQVLNFFFHFELKFFYISSEEMVEKRK